jgi:hypothetical protein
LPRFFFLPAFDEDAAALAEPFAAPDALGAPPPPPLPPPGDFSMSSLSDSRIGSPLLLPLGKTDDDDDVDNVG